MFLHKQENWIADMKKAYFFIFSWFLIILIAVFIIISGEKSISHVISRGNVLNLTNFSPSLSIQHITDKLIHAPGILMLQLVIILLIARLMGYLFQLIGQPMVIGEIVAGLLLGPSVLGIPGTPYLHRYLSGKFSRHS